MRVYLTTLGCKLNQSEIEEWARRLAAAGCHIVTGPATADVCIVNTCTVTHVAARKSRQLVRRCARANPHAQLVVTGCFAEIEPDELAGLPGVGLVLGTTDKERLTETVAERWGVSLTEPGPEMPNQPSLRTRALVKIQDGCNNACAYCVVRVARGWERSRSLQDVLNEVLARQAEGYQEIVLTGVNIGAYGRGRGETLARLVSAILEVSQLPRLRLSSIEPWDLSPDLLRLWESPRLCPHLHLPLQSGCDATLRRMNRRCSTAKYRDLVSHAREGIPDLAVTTDVIVGFPGETDDEFAVSAQFVAEMDFARIHVFPFSPRPGTSAALMLQQVPAPIKKGRAKRMRTMAAASGRAFRARFIGRTTDVLWETREGDTWSGLTGSYIRVATESTRVLHNHVTTVRLLEVTEEGVRGELVNRLGA